MKTWFEDVGDGRGCRTFTDQKVMFTTAQPLWWNEMLHVVFRTSARIPTKPHLPSGCFPATEVAEEAVVRRLRLVTLKRLRRYAMEVARQRRTPQ